MKKLSILLAMALMLTSIGAGLDFVMRKKNLITIEFMTSEYVNARIDQRICLQFRRWKRR